MDASAQGHVLHAGCHIQQPSAVMDGQQYGVPVPALGVQTLQQLDICSMS
jgi:hypothetical protein